MVYRRLRDNLGLVVWRVVLTLAGGQVSDVGPGPRRLLSEHPRWPRHSRLLIGKSLFRRVGNTVEQDPVLSDLCCTIWTFAFTRPRLS